MKSCGVLLLTAVVVCVAAEKSIRTLCARVDGNENRRECEQALRAKRGERDCRRENNITMEEFHESLCTLPTDPDVQERVGKYSLCYYLIIRQVHPNGTLAIPKSCDREAAVAKDSSPKPPSRCDILRQAAACVKEKEAESGSNPEQRAMAGRVCLCQAKNYTRLVKRCRAPEVQEEPYCVEVRRRRGGEAQCRKDSGLTSRQLKDGRCKLPEEADVQEKLAKYSMCSLLNKGEMLSNGTTKMIFADVNCSDATPATTEASARNRKRQERIAYTCEVKKRFAACIEEKIAEQASGTELEKKALAHQLCKCEAAVANAQHRHRKDETTTQ